MTHSRAKQDQINRSLKKIYYERIEAAKWILGERCTGCNEEKNKLQFDHIDPSRKEFTITRKIRWMPWDGIMAELSKCQLLCTPCHKEKNKTDNGEAVHGSITMYRHYKCRCEPCRSSYSIYAKEWRRKKREQELSACSQVGR